MALDIRGMAPLLSVFDMPASLRFYRDALGFEIASRSGPDDNCGWALLRLNGVEVMLNTAYDDGQRPPAPDPAHHAAHEDVTLYFGSPDLDGIYNYLRGLGIPVKEPVIQSYGMRQVYSRDPDGYGICFQWVATEEMREQWRQWYGASAGS